MTKLISSFIAKSQKNLVRSVLGEIEKIIQGTFISIFYRLFLDLV